LLVWYSSGTGVQIPYIFPLLFHNGSCKG
jgi:hypothetical protein